VCLAVDWLQTVLAVIACYWGFVAVMIVTWVTGDVLCEECEACILNEGSGWFYNTDIKITTVG
jgi:hypothetical protein